MKRRLILIFTVIMLATSSFVATLENEVEANSTLQNRIKNIQEERSENQAEVEQKEQEIKELEQEKKVLQDEIRVIDHRVSETNQLIREKEKEIEATKERIEDLVEEIRILEERIAERDDLLKNRVRSMYKNGGSVNYIEVILGSRSFGDLINRVTALNTIAQQDRSILEAHHNDKLAVEAAKLEMEQELIGLEDQLSDLEKLNSTLAKQRQDKDRVMNQLQEQESEIHSYIMSLEEEDQILAVQEKAMKAELAAWQERQRLLEEERKRQEQASRNNGGSSNTTPPVTADGQFMRPTTGNITSHYGMRWGQMHHGLDIGKGGRPGDVHVVAVEAGTVIRSNYNVSYGNVVMISHNVNGRVVTTVYAHLENRFVVEGQRVEKGQLLGYMGNTGHSFGAHLHFEVHEGPWNGARSNSVNPLPYIPN